MAYDEELATRVREAVAERVECTEKKMFGGLAFMINTHMACGLMSQGLMVRVGSAGYQAALEQGGGELRMGERTMGGMVIVSPEQLDDPAVFDRWITKAIDFALAEPPKPPKRPKKPTS
jgi:TfoX/Sxy family transcriptional regulator of competence genes